MIISANPTPLKEEFDLLLESTILNLNTQAKTSSKTISLLAGNKLEPFIKDTMAALAIGTPFENSIELKSGQKFPDIVANKFYGVEVKSSMQNHWKTTGNSVLESTRVETVERIYMLFGKLGRPMEFRCRPYEECLAEVVVTHSPRYLVDMNLVKGATIFDKMNITYDALRTKPNPIKPVVEYYKSKLRSGEDIWWMGQGDNMKSSSFIIKIWNNLTPNEKNILRVKAMTFFPELFGNRNDKFGRLAIYLVTREAIVCPNIRDLFTAGGKSDIKIGNKTYYSVPRILITLINNLPNIVEIIMNTSAIELSDHWQHRATEKTKLKTWIDLVSEEVKKITGANHLDIKTILEEVMLTR